MLHGEERRRRRDAQGQRRRGGCREGRLLPHAAERLPESAHAAIIESTMTRVTLCRTYLTDQRAREESVSRSPTGSRGRCAGGYAFDAEGLLSARASMRMTFSAPSIFKSRRRAMILAC